MKTYTLQSTPHDILQSFPLLQRRLAAADTGGPPVCLGADLEKAGACVAAQVGLGAPLALGTLPRGQIVALAGAIAAQGRTVAVGVEACGFGWRFQDELRARGAQVFTFAPEPLTGRRKTNRRDAAALSRVVAERVAHGNPQAGRVVREPSALEQQRRYYTRHRGHLVALRGKMEAHGRGLLLDFGRVDYPECWWGRKMWPVLARQLEQSGEAWLLEELGAQRARTYRLHQEILELDKKLELLSAELLPEQLPAGLGTLTALTAFVEVMDWNRFGNRKQAGSFIGCCPSEQSTGVGQVLGGIDRQGNRRLRSALTEAVWRLLRWEPGWRGFEKWGALLRDKNAGGVRRKKAVIACVRLLFIDLWRLFTGRTTYEALGLRGTRRGREEAAGQ